MKKIINRKLYDTNTAEFIANYCYGCGGDLYFLNASLYRKKTGEFFLGGEGGARTKYGDTDGDSYFGSWDIIPLTEDEARDWIEEHCSADEYIEVFGEVEE